MFMVPLTMRDFFFEDPFFQTTWHDYDRLRNFMFAQPRGVWKRFDEDFRQLACMANNIMVDWDQSRDLLRLERERSRTVPIQRKGEQGAVEGGAPPTAAGKEAETKTGGEPMETEPAAGEKAAAPTAEKAAPAVEKEAPRERKTSRERRLVLQDPLARWQRSWMFPRRWMLPSLKEGDYEQLFRDLGLFRERDGDVVRVRDDKDALEITFDMSQYRPDELYVCVQGGLLCVQGRHEEGEEGRKQVVRQFLRRFNMPTGSGPEDVSSNLSSDGVLVVAVKKPKAHEIPITKQQKPQVQQQQQQSQQPPQQPQQPQQQ